jgi:uncharacterized membrane protein YdbT with pleckstrin-like domain
MIEEAAYLNCRPSQILNLRYFLLTLVLAPLFFLLKEPVIQQIPSGFIPGKLLIHIHRFPVYLNVVLIFNLGYHVLDVWCTRYEISKGELKHYSGIMHRKHGYIELYRIKDFQVDKPLIYRFFRLGNLVVYTSDKTTPEFRLEAVRDVEDIYKVLRGLVELNRREKHVFEID